MTTNAIAFDRDSFCNMNIDSKLLLEFEQRLDDSTTNVSAFIDECCEGIDAPSILLLIGVYAEKLLSKGQSIDADQLCDEFNSIPSNDIELTIAQAAANFTETYCPVSSQLGRMPIEHDGYLIESEIARGGSGVVYLARQLSVDRKVAIKVRLFPSANIESEARVLSRIDHPNVLKVYDQGEIGNLSYIVTQLVQGTSLKSYCRNPPTLSPFLAAKLVLKILDAVSECHCRGIIHWDLKPSNILVLDGEPVILDFGLAGSSSDRALRQVGSPGYMAPELLSATEIESPPLCDVFSVGTILYELLTGNKPFPSGANAFVQSPRLPTSHRENLDSYLEAICLRAIEIKPEDRYQTALRFRGELESWIEHGDRPQDQSTNLTLALSPKKTRDSHTLFLSILTITCLLTLANLLHGFLRSRSPAANAAEAAQVKTRFDITVDVYREDVASESVFLLGTLGNDKFNVRENDYVTITARSSTPLYCHVMAANPDGTLQTLVASSNQVTELVFPATKKELLQLSDGTGQQAYILIATTSPIPDWDVWQSMPPEESGWKPSIPSQGVWFAQGAEIERILDSDVERGDIKPTSVSRPLQHTIAWIQRRTKGKVCGIAFPVKP